mgnify:CR=1 FL=1|jgi:hypothetical protein
MFDLFWKWVAGVAAFAALVFGMLAKRRKDKAEREKAERAIAERDAVDRALLQLEETRRKWDAKAPADPSKRRDFEEGM